jgi:hypothetical protein
MRFYATSQNRLWKTRRSKWGAVAFVKHHGFPFFSVHNTATWVSFLEAALSNVPFYGPIGTS